MRSGGNRGVPAKLASAEAGRLPGAAHFAWELRMRELLEVVRGGYWPDARATALPDELWDENFVHNRS
jgi:hypothetical protein